MKIEPLNLFIKIIADCISNKYKNIDPNEYRHWNIDVVNENNDMFILSSHNYDMNLFTPDSVKDPSGCNWYCFLDVLERSRHVMVKSILQGHLIDFISPLEMLRYSSIKNESIEGFLDFLVSKKISKRNLATIKQLILNNKTTIVYLAYLKKGNPVFEIMFDNNTKLIEKILALFKEWINSKNIFSYSIDQVSKDEYPSRVENVSAFNDIFDISLPDFVDYIVSSDPEGAKGLLIDLVGIPEYDLNIPDFVKDSLPNMLVVKGVI
jgi:hypothetical protein